MNIENLFSDQKSLERNPCKNRKLIMGTVPDQSVLEALRGNAVESLKHPSPRLVKIYISSSKQGKTGRFVCTNALIEFLSPLHPTCCRVEFKEERKVLLEVIGPELQSIYDDRQIEVCGINC